MLLNFLKSFGQISCVSRISQLIGVTPTMKLSKKNLKLFLYLLIPIISGIIYIGKAQKYPKIILYNYEYQMHIKEHNRTRWRCKYQKKLKCRAVLYTTGKNVYVSHPHSHDPQNIKHEGLVAQKVDIIYKN